MPTGTIPKIQLVESNQQQGVADFALFAYDRGSGQLVWNSGTMLAISSAKDIYFVGAGPIQSGSIRGGTNVFGIKIPQVSESHWPTAPRRTIHDGPSPSPRPPSANPPRSISTRSLPEPGSSLEPRALRPPGHLPERGPAEGERGPVRTEPPPVPDCPDPGTTDPVRVDPRDWIRDVPDFPKPGILFKDITPMLGHPEAFRAVIDRMTEAFASRSIDSAAAAAAGSSSALRWPCAGPGSCRSASPASSPTSPSGSNTSSNTAPTAWRIHSDAIGTGNACFVDDVLATGGNDRPCLPGPCRPDGRRGRRLRLRPRTVVPQRSEPPGAG